MASAKGLSVWLRVANRLVESLNASAVSALLVLDRTPRGAAPSPASSAFGTRAASTMLTLTANPLVLQLARATRAAPSAASRVGPRAAATGGSTAAFGSAAWGDCRPANSSATAIGQSRRTD